MKNDNYKDQILELLMEVRTDINQIKGLENGDFSDTFIKINTAIEKIYNSSLAPIKPTILINKIDRRKLIDKTIENRKKAEKDLEESNDIIALIIKKYIELLKNEAVTFDFISRKQGIVEYRFYIIWYLRSFHNYTLKKIATIMGCDHSTVLHNFNSYNDSYKYYIPYQELQRFNKPLLNYAEQIIGKK